MSSVKLTQLAPPPGTVAWYPAPKYWHSASQKKDFFVLAAGGTDRLSVLAYDFTKDRWDTLCDYPEDVNPINAIASIDGEKNLLYLSHGNEPLLAICNLDTKVWQVFVTESDDTYNPYRDEKMVKGSGRGRILPNGEYHLLITTKLHNQHVKYDHDNKKFVPVSQLSINKNCHLKQHALMYVTGKNYLMQLGGVYGAKPSQSIYYTDFSETEPIKRKKIRGQEEIEYDGDDGKDEEENYKGRNYVWQEHPTLKLPLPAKQVSIAYCFGRKVIIIFLRQRAGKGATFILDSGVPEEEWKWVKSRLDRNDHPVRCSIIVSKTKALHFIYAERRKPLHFKVHLSQFLPKDIWEKYATEQDAEGDDEKDDFVVDGDDECANCKQYQSKIRQLQTLVDDLIRNQNTLEIDRRAIEQREERLNQEIEQMTLELNEVKAELAKLRRKNMDTSKFMEWTADEFVDYICTLEDGKYSKYEMVLRDNFKQEEIAGEAIPHIEKNEWRDFGIKNYMDRTKLHKAIKNLVSGNPEGGPTNYL